MIIALIEIIAIIPIIVLTGARTYKAIIAVIGLYLSN